MAKYNTIFMDIKNKELVGFDELPLIEQRALENNNVVYIYRNKTNKQIYIGQTKHFLTRNKQHYNGLEERFNQIVFDEVCILFSKYFNMSALDDVESQLIAYFSADLPKGKKNGIGYDYNEVTNSDSGNRINEYSEREKVASEVILPFWENELFSRGWVHTKTIDQLRASELFKYSPIKSLTAQQMDLINEIRNHDTNSYVIHGDAGTGKTVLLTHLVAMYMKEYPNKKVAVVLQPNWIKIAKGIFRVYGMNSSNLTIASSTQLINGNDSYDVIIVDESHKISRKFSKQMASFNSVYVGEFASEENHLACMKKMGTQIVLMYDEFQAIRPANITRQDFDEATSQFEHRYLKTQFRIEAARGRDYTSEDYMNGIKYLLYKDTGLLNEQNFNENFNRSVFNDFTPDAYFGYVESEPLKTLFDWLETDQNFNAQHVNRVLGGLVEPWKQADGKNELITHWHEGELKKRWNSTQENWLQSTDQDAEDQIGSVFAVQGMDLNKVGVLIGNDLQVDAEGKLFGNPDNFHNVNGKFSKDDQSLENEREFTIFVLNIYYILMTRGIDGIRLGFWKNDDFKKYMLNTLEIETVNRLISQ